MEKAPKPETKVLLKTKLKPNTKVFRLVDIPPWDDDELIGHV